MAMIIRIDYGTTLRNGDHAVCFGSFLTESNDRLRLVEILISMSVRISHGVLRLALTMGATGRYFSTINKL